MCLDELPLAIIIKSAIEVLFLKFTISTSFALLSINNNLPLVIFRPGIVIGKGCPPAHWGVGMFESDTRVQLWGNGKNKLPFVTGKLAISKDNCIYSKKRKKITNEYSHSITHLLRYKNDSILISNKTLNIDNPKLNCRIHGLSHYSPKRIILDRNLSIKRNSYIFKTSTKKNTIIFYLCVQLETLKALKKH